MEHVRQELELTQDKPHINPKSARISMKLDTHVPIYERFEKIKERKQRRIERRRAEIEQQKRE